MHVDRAESLSAELDLDLARMEGRIALEEILNRWPDWKIDMSGAQRSLAIAVRGWDTMSAETG